MVSKTVLFYGPVANYTVEFFVNQLEEAAQYVNPTTLEAVEKVKVRINTNGGSVTSGWGMVKNLIELREEHPDMFSIKVDGSAYSWGAFACLFFKDVEAMNVSRFMLHRAAYPEWYNPSEEEMAMLIDTNKTLEKYMREKLNVARLEKLAGMSLRQFMDSNKPQKDLFLTAAQAKSIGLIKNVVNLSPEAKGEMVTDIAAYYAGDIDEPETSETETNLNMDIKAFKADHKDLHDQVITAGQEQGKDEELIRAKAWLKFKEIDAAKVMEGIESGEPIGADDIAHFEAEAIRKKTAELSAGGNPPSTTTEGNDPEGEGNDPQEFDAEAAAEAIREEQKKYVKS